MNLKKAKELRRLVFGHEGQGVTKYEEMNPARYRKINYDVETPYTVLNCFFQHIRRVKTSVVRDVFYPDGTRKCIGPRGVYRIMKAKFKGVHI